MAFRLSCLMAFGLAVMMVSVNAAAIDNSVFTETPRINSGEDLVSTIISSCFHGEAMHCIKEKVLVYLDTITGVNEEQARSFDDKNIDKVIFDRVGRVLATNEFHVQMPETFFQKAIVTYRVDRGLDFQLPQEEARGDDMKKKLLLPILLLLKLKLKAITPILLGLVGLKAMKALILSKLAIKIVLGFVIYQLVQKLGGMKMGMTPMAPAEPMSAYGVPSPTTPASSYEPSWEPSGGPYSRVWEPSSASSAQSLAYSAYYPGSSSSSSGSSSSSSGSSSSSSSPSSSSSYSYSP